MEEEVFIRENEGTFNYLAGRVDIYSLASAKAGDRLKTILFGVNGEKLAKMKERIIQINTLSSLFTQSTYHTIDYLFAGDPAPEEVISRLEQSKLIYQEAAGCPTAFNLRIRPKRLSRNLIR